MVKNHRRKKRIRAAADADGSKYTAALRKDQAQPPEVALPSAYGFPDRGTSQFAEIVDLAGRGIFRFGPQSGGGWLEWNLNETPHSLISGRTGAGKSIAVSLVLFNALYLPDQVEVIVCDPKRYEFPWVTEFPSVVRYARTDEEICEAVEVAAERLATARALLNRTQVRNLGLLRAKYALDPEMEAQHGPVPKRLIVIFEAIADFLPPCEDSELEERKDKARTSLETIGRLGRAPEVNIVCTAQKLDPKVISTQLRSQLGFRLGVGPLDQYESHLTFGSDHGTRFPEAGAPKGRAWAYDPKNGYRQAQVMFLPEDPMPWPEGRDLPGARDLLRHRLTRLGYQRTSAEPGEAGTATRWSRPDSAH